VVLVYQKVVRTHFPTGTLKSPAKIFAQSSQKIKAVHFAAEPCQEGVLTQLLIFCKQKIIRWKRKM